MCTAANTWINFIAVKKHCVSVAAFFSENRFGYLSRGNANINTGHLLLRQRHAMKNQVFGLLAVMSVTVSAGFAQAINVTPAGVDMGATTSTTAGALLQQSGQTTTFWSKDGVNTPLLLVKIQGDGKVGIGTGTPSERLSVSGNAVISGNATVGALVVGSTPIFTVGSFESAEQAAPATNTSLTIPHGLGGIPRSVTVSLRCKIAEEGWAVGDEILLNCVDIQPSGYYGATTGANAVNIKYVQKGTLAIHSFTDSGWNYITAANWRLVFRAWR